MEIYILHRTVLANYVRNIITYEVMVWFKQFWLCRKVLTS